MMTRALVLVQFPLLLVCGMELGAQLRLPRVFADHMVLQRDVRIPVWGWAAAGGKIAVKFGEHAADCVAGADGTWRVELPAMKAGGPHTMTVRAASTITLKDVLVGEVWLCSGQSNMEMGVKAIKDAEREVAASKNPQIRLCAIPKITAGEPRRDVAATWRVCGPKAVVHGAFGGFSAVGYFFGRRLFEELGVPIGLIDSSWGGTRIEPWTPPGGFEDVESLRKIAKEIADRHRSYRSALPARLTHVESWVEATRAALQSGGTLPPAPNLPRHPTNNAVSPSGLYNGMIHPLVPFAIRGAIWYQGESNLGDGMAYLAKMKALIGGWRKVWGQGDFPFYFVQLAPYNYGRRRNPQELPAIWEAQTAALAIVNTGMAVTTDIANLGDIHPKNKQDVAARLALWALAKTYDRKDLVHSGPIYKSMKIEGDKIRLEFTHVGSGLAMKGKILEWFDIAGENQRFEKAHAKIDGNSVVVWSEVVKKPVAVRFAWHMLAEPKLVNKEGLPASPFRTDKW